VFGSRQVVQAQFKNAPGYEWSTWGIWDAENRADGAPISYFVKASTDTSAKSKKDSVAVKIFNDKNEVIRNLKWTADSGFNRRTWGMEQKGFKQPGMGGGRRGGGGRSGEAEPGGQQALPGTYKVVLTYKGSSDSTMITLLDDPRLGNRNNVKMAQQELRLELKKSGDQLISALEILTEADEASKKMETFIKDMKGNDADSLKKTTKKIQDEVKRLREYINGKTQTKQGYGQVPQITVMSEFQQANSSISSKPIVPGAQEKALVVRAAGLVDEAVKKINSFKDGMLKEYKDQVSKAKLDPFGK
jgi:gas vesicle protein